MEVKEIERVAQQLPIESIEEHFGDDGGVHYLIGCYRAITGHYTISCACAWRHLTGKSAAESYKLMRAHIAGHRAREKTAGE